MLRPSRLKPNAFVRQRTLTFPVLLIAMIGGFKASVQNELNAFFAQLANQADLVRLISAQAFSRARRLFSHLAFAKRNDRLMYLVEQEGLMPHWHGLRVLAADASKMRLCLQYATRRCVQEAIAFALYLPGLEMTLAGKLYAPSVGERRMLFEHLDGMRASDLLVLDQGYPAHWLIALLAQLGIPFCMRVDETGFTDVKAFLRSGEAERTVLVRPPNRPDCTDYECVRTSTSVRLVRVVTPNGRVHVVMTSLLDAQVYPAADFAALYHSRWRIEEVFKRLKHRLALENTSGLSWRAAHQDFGAKLLADNLDALAVRAATSLAELPFDYKINRTYAFAHLKRCLPRWLLIAVPTVESFIAVATELARLLIRFKPGHYTQLQ